MCTEAVLKADQSGAGVTRRAALFGAATATAAAASTVLAPTASAAEHRHRGRRGHRHVLDLTYPLTTTFPAYAIGEESTRRTHVTIEEDGYYLQQWSLFEHHGTHVDAPGHFWLGGRLVTDLRPEELVVPAVVVDIADRAAQDPDTVVTVDDLRAWERRHGRIPRDAAVLMYSGWGEKVGDADAYRGVDSSGSLHFPGFGPEACEWLVTRREIRAIGVDTLSTDPGVSTTFDTHLVLAEADSYGIENLANLEHLPSRGTTITVGVVPFEEGSGGQARVLALP